MQRIRSQLLAQALQGAGDVFFHGLGCNSTVPRDLRIAHAGDPVEQVHLARTLGQFEKGLPQQGQHLPGLCLAQGVRRRAGGLVVTIMLGQ